MTQSPNRKHSPNFELSISIRLDGIYLFDLHQLPCRIVYCLATPEPFLRQVFDLVALASTSSAGVLSEDFSGTIRPIFGIFDE
jgi:hypothetical protein